MMRQFLSYARTTRNNHPGQAAAALRRRTDRRGSVLLIVIGLLGLLLLLGITFFTFAAQEDLSAQGFSEGSKNPAVLNGDAIFDFALEQILLGPDYSNTQSALWSGRHSMVPNLLGQFDQNRSPASPQPFAGQGINLVSTAGGAPVIDQDRDGTADASNYLLQFNLSPAATGSTTWPSGYPAANPGYTYPDINNLFLAWDGYNAAGYRVIIPSFHRPQYLRDLASGTNNGVPIPDWADNPVSSATYEATLSTRLLRPHPFHVIPGTGTVLPDGAGTAVKRFLTTAYTVTGTPSHTVQPFPFRNGGANRQQGVWSSPVTGTYDYDVDNDADGTTDSIWLDLGFPAQTMPNGRYYIPLFAVKIESADGLANLNIHSNLPFPGTGNLPNLNQPIGTVGGVPGFLSKSNQGLSPTEVNLQWALFADPNNVIYISAADYSDAFQSYRGIWGGNPADRTEMSNMDLLSLLWGRPGYNVSGTPPSETFTITDLFEGRWGERTALYNAIYNGGVQTTFSGGVTSNAKNPLTFPRPGTRSQQPVGNPSDSGDDEAVSYDINGLTQQGDRYEGRYVDDSNNQLPVDPKLGMTPPAFVHPLDLNGHGNSRQTVSGTGRKAWLAGDPTDTTNNPSRWPYYDGYQYYTRYQSSLGTAYDGSNLGGHLSQNQNAYGAIDEGDEVITDRTYAQTSDKIFGPEEMPGLHLGATDFENLALSSRLQQLMPFNLVQNSLAGTIRKQFTTENWDRRQHGLSAPQPSSWRQWEWNADTNNNGRFEFPPAFVGTSEGYTGNPGGSGSEPFRAVLRSILESEQPYTYYGNDSIGWTSGGNVPAPNTNPFALRRQLRLNLNRLLTADASSGSPVYRNLTPHPVLNNTGDNNPITTSPTTSPPFASGTPNTDDQEYWARRDRQQMARDIYVLLYTLGGPSNSARYADTDPMNYDDNGANIATAVRPLYNDAQLEQMAQFAVNYVDALDRDNVITKFEFDRNLGDGWNLGDNPYSTADDAAATLTPVTTGATADRGVVYGVEAQMLTFSEVISIFCDQAGTGLNHAATTYDDAASTHHYLFVELRNASPHDVVLNNGSWRIRRIDTATPALPVVNRRLTIYGGGVSDSGTSLSQVDAGQQFTIGTSDGTDQVSGMTGVYRSSDFRVDYQLTADGQFDRIVPGITDSGAAPMATDNPNPGCNLDLVHDRDSGLFTLYDGTGATVTRGGFLHNTPAEPAVDAATSVLLTLERRVHLTRTAPVHGVLSESGEASNSEEQDNPWIEVDRMSATIRDFNVMSGAALKSQTEIRTDLQNNLQSWERPQPLTRSGESLYSATLSLPFNNTVGANANSNTPGYGAGTPQFNLWQPHFDRDFTSTIDLLSIPLYGPENFTNVTSGFNARGTNTAGQKFLNPVVGGIQDNCWYRLLEMVEIPSRANQQIEHYFNSINVRISGKVDLNNVRHPAVFAGLIDDSQQIALTDGSPFYPAIGPRVLTDQFESSRDWWAQFTQARDQIDPQSGLVLPGSPASRPFQNFGSVENTSSYYLERTLLRSLPLDGVPNTGRRLFEARSSADASAGNPQVDYHTKNRLLAKLANNATNRSNVFIVWITVGYFEAVNNNGNYQIGAEIANTGGAGAATNLARRRGFFLVDRSQLEQAVDATTGKLDWRKFVQYRQTIQ